MLLALNLNVGVSPTSRAFASVHCFLLSAEILKYGPLAIFWHGSLSKISKKPACSAEKILCAEQQEK
jgi:hypothetical protein